MARGVPHPDEWRNALPAANEPAELHQENDVELGSMQRLGETGEFGWLLLRLLDLAGFHVHVTAPFAPAEGRRILVIVTRGPFTFQREADQVADIACDLYLEAMAYRHAA